MKKTSWFLLVLLFAFSCLDDPDCFRLNNNVVGIAFRVLGSTAADSITFNAISLGGNTVWTPTEGVDTTVAFMALLLPLPGEESAVTNTFGFPSGEGTPMLSVSYETKVQFVSEECGVRYIYSDLKVNEHDFNQVEVLNATPGRDASSANIYVYRCPKADTIGVSFNQLTLPATGAASSRPLSARLNGITIDDAQQVYLGRSASSVRLPANTAAATSTYVFDFADDFAYDVPLRTLALNYDVVRETRYEVCGEQAFVEGIEIAETEGDAFDEAVLAEDSNGNLLDVATDPETNNINLYRCPPTNLIQVTFVNEEGNARSRKILSVTPDFGEPLYVDTTYSRIQLPLNRDANSTTFIVALENVTETITLDYSWTTPRTGLFREGSSCAERLVITDLREGADNPNATLVSPRVLFPAVNNVNIEVAD